MQENRFASVAILFICLIESISIDSPLLVLRCRRNVTIEQILNTKTGLRRVREHTLQSYARFFILKCFDDVYRKVSVAMESFLFLNHIVLTDSLFALL